MAKKKARDRGPTTNSIRRQHRNEPSSSDDADDQFTATGGRGQRSIALFVIFFVIFPAISAVIYTRYFRPPSTLSTSSSSGQGLPDSYVFRRGLVIPAVNFQDILNENAKVSDNSSHRFFENPVLAYVTPWNSRGYDLAKVFNSKFTHLSPVWYDLKSQGKDLVLEGRHNADTEWISELRAKGNAQILPRIVLEALPHDLLKNKKQRDKAIDLIVEECKEMGYDGVVLESWSRWAAYGVLNDASMRKLAIQFLRNLGEALHSVKSDSTIERNLQLIYVIGPPRQENLQDHDFGPDDLESLNGYVDGFSLMTYDFSGPNSPGPNAPLKWIKSTLRVLLQNADNRSLAQKIFLGLNFYGYDFPLQGGGAQAITGRDYLSLLNQYKPAIQWQKKSAEHIFIYVNDQNRQHAVFYPSLMSIWTRLDEARSWGAGISIWEIGQGLDFFYDLL